MWMFFYHLLFHMHLVDYREQRKRFRWYIPLYYLHTAQKIKFSVMENFIFCAVSIIMTKQPFGGVLQNRCS